MARLEKACALSGYRLAVQFEDGVSGTIELEADLWGPYSSHSRMNRYSIK